MQKGALVRVVLHAVHEALGLNRPINYSRSKSADHWSSPRIKKLNYYSYDLIIRAIDFLEVRGLIYHLMGHAGTLGRQSEFSAVPPLVSLLRHIPYDILKPGDPIILRNGENEEINVPNTREVDRMAKRVDAQNRLILDTDFTSRPDLKSPLRRIFRHDMRHRGRFYSVGMSWQNVGNEIRMQIELDGQKTTLLDYSACNPGIAYRSIQKPPPEDLYFSNNFSRSDAKFAMVVLLNAINKTKAIRAVAFDRKFICHGSSDFLGRLRDANRLISELEANHAPLLEAGQFYGSGLSITWTESQIADKIMAELRKLKIVVLPIHDGFIVKKENGAILREAMLECSKLNLQSSIPVSKEY